MSLITDELDALVIRFKEDGFPTALIERASIRMKDMEAEIVRQHGEIQKLDNILDSAYREKKVE
jgi:hypothetical protein